ncbi:MAG: hypothetical protein ACYDBX_04580 [Patescibacteria group bacterium]
MKFNFKRGSATPKGRLNSIRLISKDHSVYPLVFDKNGQKYSDERIKKNFENRAKKNDTLKINE